MTQERPAFRTARPSWRVGLAPLGVAVGVTALIGVSRVLGVGPTEPAGTLVEVRGDVPRPGWHRVEPPTIEAALRAAGDDRRISATPVHEGDQITVSDDGIRHHPRGNPLLIGLPVDVNDASTEALEAVPGIGPAVASAIVENRNLEGPFYEVGDLVRVPGLGPKKVEGLAPLLTVGDIGPRPPVSLIDVNTASAAALERLPGIGPTLAARIVVDRAEQGRFRTLDDLRRVRGITPATIHRLRTYAEAR